MTYKRNQYQTGVRAVNTGYEKVIKEGDVHVKSLQEKAKTDIKNQIRVLGDVRAETARAFKSETGIDKYEAERFAQLSGKVKDFFQGTWVKIGQEVKERVDSKQEADDDKDQSSTRKQTNKTTPIPSSTDAVPEETQSNTGITEEKEPTVNPLLAGQPPAPSGGSEAATSPVSVSEVSGANSISIAHAGALSKAATDITETQGPTLESQITTARGIQAIMPVVTTGNASLNVSQGGAARWRDFLAAEMNTVFIAPDGKTEYTGKDALKNPVYLGQLSLLHLQEETARLRKLHGLGRHAAHETIYEPLKAILQKNVANDTLELRAEQNKIILNTYEDIFGISMLKAIGDPNHKTAPDLAVVLKELHGLAFNVTDKGDHSKKTRHEITWDWMKTSLINILKQNPLQAEEIVAEFNKTASETEVETPAGKSILSDRKQFVPAELMNKATEIKQAAITAIKTGYTNEITNSVKTLKTELLENKPENIDTKTWLESDLNQNKINKLRDTLLNNIDYQTYGMQQTILNALSKLDTDLMYNKAETIDIIDNMLKDNGGGYVTEKQILDKNLDYTTVKEYLDTKNREIRNDDPIKVDGVEYALSIKTITNQVKKTLGDEYLSGSDNQDPTFANALKGAEVILNNRIYDRYYIEGGNIRKIIIEEGERLQKEIETNSTGFWGTETNGGFPQWETSPYSANNSWRKKRDADTNTLYKARKLKRAGKPLHGLIKNPDRFNKNPTTDEYSAIVRQLARMDGVPPHQFVAVSKSKLGLSDPKDEAPDPYKALATFCENANLTGEVCSQQYNLKQNNLSSKLNKRLFNLMAPELSIEKALRRLQVNEGTFENNPNFTLDRTLMNSVLKKLKIRTSNRKSPETLGKVLTYLNQEEWPKIKKGSKTEIEAIRKYIALLTTGDTKNIDGEYRESNEMYLDYFKKTGVLP